MAPACSCAEKISLRRSRIQSPCSGIRRQNNPHMWGCSEISSMSSFRKAMCSKSPFQRADPTRYLLQMKILPTHKRCSCGTAMRITSSPPSRYHIGSCWLCDHCKSTLSLRNGSCLQNSNLSYRSFIDVLDKFSTNSTVSEAA